MSCDWNIHCVTCNSTHKFDDANHQDDLMRFLIKHAAAIAALATMMEDAQSIPSCSPTLFAVGDAIQPCWRISPRWFAAHLGHDLRPISEYGDVEPPMACEKCGLSPAERCQVNFAWRTKRARVLCESCLAPAIDAIGGVEP